MHEDFSRKDTCLSCYAPTKATTWKQKFKQKVSVKEDNHDEMDRAWELLLTSEGEEAYILALYLVRKKILARRGKEGLYEHLETGEMIKVEEVDLKQFSIPEIHNRLQSKLQ